MQQVIVTRVRHWSEGAVVRVGKVYEVLAGTIRGCWMTR
jgi:hypothetical protein